MLLIRNPVWLIRFQEGRGGDSEETMLDSVQILCQKNSIQHLFSILSPKLPLLNSPEGSQVVLQVLQ